MMLRQPLTRCSKAAPNLSACLKSRSISTFRSTTPRRMAAVPLISSTLTLASLRPTTNNIISKSLTRSYQQQSAFPARTTSSPSFLQRAILAGGVFGATALLLQFLNRETREGAIPPHQKEYLHGTFIYTGAGVAMIGFAAKALHNIGWSYRMMAMNPLLFAGISLAGGIGTMIATRMTPPENFVLKHTLWAGFNLSQAMVLSPMFFYHPALIARAGLYTVSLMGGLCFIGATAKTDQYLWLGGPLMAGMGVVLVSGLAPMILPMGGAALAISEKVFMYGGLAVFSGFTLYDTQKILKHGELAHRGLMKRDPVNECISLELDFINIFVRMMHILGNRNQRK